MSFLEHRRTTGAQTVTVLLQQTPSFGHPSAFRDYAATLVQGELPPLFALLGCFCVYPMPGRTRTFPATCRFLAGLAFLLGFLCFILEIIISSIGSQRRIH